MNIYTKTYLLLLLWLTACTVPLQARDKYKSQGENICFAVQQVAKQNDSLSVELVIYASNLHIGTMRSLRVDLFLQQGNKQMALPPVVYTGRQRKAFDRRNELLNPLANGKEPYRVFTGIDSEATYPLHYKVSIPYQAWMDHARLTAREVYHDCCNQYPLKEQTLLADINLKNEIREMVTEPQPRTTGIATWNPDPAVYRRMASLLQPESETVKERSSSIELHIDYPQGVYKVLPDFGRNAQQLARVSGFMASVTDNELITLNHMLITGYASPEGTYASNELLACRRSEGFMRYLQAKYNLNKYPVQTNWIAEDWDGLTTLVKKSQMDYKDEVLSIIASTDIFDGREKKLMELYEGKPYRNMLKEMFPSLRRIELAASYVVSNISEQKAKELLYTRPEMLSLEEMYRVATNYTPGAQEYQLVYEIAARTYFNNAIANNNAAAACLMNGDTVSAQLYLNKLSNNPIGHINRAVYSYILGDIQQAEKYLRMALESEDTRKQAEKNLLLLNNVNK